MGHATALGFAGAVADGSISLQAALHYHLTVNHYPPLPAFFNAVCERAIEAANDGNDGSLIDLPAGIEWKDGRGTVEAYVLIESFRLDAFLTDDRPRCPACGDVSDFCQGHGEIGDPAGNAVLAQHDDDDDHGDCHPAAGCGQ